MGVVQKVEGLRDTDQPWLDNVMPYRFFVQSSFCIKIWEGFFFRVLKWMSRTGVHEQDYKMTQIKYDKHDKHDSDPIQGWVTLWSKLVLHRSCYRYSGVRCVWILAGCRTILTILLVRLSQLSDYRIELSVRPRPIWSWPFQSSADINAWTMRLVGVVGVPSAKFWLI